MNTSIMSKPLAKAFLNVITIMQDGSHNKEKWSSKYMITILRQMIRSC